MMDPVFLSKEIQGVLLAHKTTPSSATPVKASLGKEKEREREREKIDLSKVALSVPVKSHFSLPAKIADPQRPRHLSGALLVKNVASFLYETETAEQHKKEKEKASKARHRPQPWPTVGNYHTTHGAASVTAESATESVTESVTDFVTAVNATKSVTATAAASATSSSAAALLFDAVDAPSEDDAAPAAVSFSSPSPALSVSLSPAVPLTTATETERDREKERDPHRESVAPAQSGLAHIQRILSLSPPVVASATLDLAAFSLSIPSLCAVQGRVTLYALEFDLRQIREMNEREFDAATVHRVTAAQSDYSMNKNRGGCMTNDTPRLRIVMSTSTGRGVIPKSAIEREREREIEREHARVANTFSPSPSPSLAEATRRRSLSPQRLREMMMQQEQSASRDSEEQRKSREDGRLTFLQANTKDDLFPPEVGVDTLYFLIVRASEAEDYVLNYVPRGYIVMSMPDKDRDGTVGAARQYALLLARMLRTSWAFMLDDHLAPIDALCAVNDLLLNPRAVPQAPALLPFPLLTGIKLLEDLQAELCRLSLGAVRDSVKSPVKPAVAAAKSPIKSKVANGSPPGASSTAVAQHVGVIGLAKHVRENKDVDGKHSHKNDGRTFKPSVSLASVKGVCYLHIDALFSRGVCFRRDMSCMEDLYFAQQCLLHNLAPISLNFLCHEVTTDSHTMEHFEAFLRARGGEHRSATAVQRHHTSSGSQCGSLSASNSVSNLTVSSHRSGTSSYSAKSHKKSSKKVVTMNPAVSLGRVAEVREYALKPSMACSTLSLDEYHK